MRLPVVSEKYSLETNVLLGGMLLPPPLVIKKKNGDFPIFQLLDVGGQECGS